MKVLFLKHYFKIALINLIYVHVSSTEKVKKIVECFLAKNATLITATKFNQIANNMTIIQ